MVWVTLLAALVGATAGAGAGSAGETPPPSAAASASERAALRAAKRRWRAQRARDYSYVFQRNCFCVDTGPVTIKVVDRRPRGTPGDYEHVDTAGELFKEAGEVLDSDGHHQVRYRVRAGLPSLIADDPIPNAVDDEYSYRITDLHITRRYPKRAPR